MKQGIKVICIWCICLIWILGDSIFAAGGIEFHVENQAGKAGDLVTVPVELNSGGEVGGFDVKVYYDPESMEFQELKKGELIRDDGLFDYNHKTEEAAVKIIYVVSDTIEADGKIADLVFRLKKDCDSLPLGMGLQEVIDGSEEGNKVTGQVSGTDPAYQAQVEQRIGVEGSVSSTGEQGGEVQGEGVTGEADKADEVKDGENGKNGQEEDLGEKDSTIEEVKKEEDNKQNKDREGKKYNKAVIAGIAAAALAVIVGILMRRRKAVKDILEK